MMARKASSVGSITNAATRVFMYGNVIVCFAKRKQRFCNFDGGQENMVSVCSAWLSSGRIQAPLGREKPVVPSGVGRRYATTAWGSR